MLIALAVVLGGVFLFRPGGNPEDKSPRWSMHEKAEQQHKWVGEDGNAVASIAAGQSDLAPAITHTLQTNPQAAAAALQSNNPKAGPGSVAIHPDAAPKIVEKVQKEQAKMVQVHLFDSCSEDGDQVDVFIDGVLYGRVLLSNPGTDLAVPVKPGGARLDVQGVVDGGGGITLGLRTSTGVKFSPILKPGASISVDLVAP